MVFSYFYWLNNEAEMSEIFQFEQNTFFFFCLPPIVFASGFNMRRSNFFANFKNTMIFGVLGTFVSFISFSFATIWLTGGDWMKEY